MPVGAYRPGDPSAWVTFGSQNGSLNFSDNQGFRLWRPEFTREV